MILSRNISLMYFIKFFKGLLFSVSIVYLFYNHYNLWATELYIVQSVFAIGVVLFEIPTGFISDKYSRKLSLIIWLLLSSIWYSIYSFSTTLLWFIVAELILVIGYCCVSWTDTSLIYDTIMYDGDISDYKKISGKYNSFWSLAEAIWWIAGWYIALYGLSLPFLLDSVVAWFACILACFLIEPPRKKLDPLEWSFDQIKQTLSYVYNHNRIFWLIIFSALTSTMTISMVRFSQPYMTFINLPLVWFWWFRFAMNISGFIVNSFIHKIESYFTETIFMNMIIIRWVSCMLLLAFFPSIWILPVFLLFQITRQGNRLISNDNLHLLTDSSVRATIQSISSMIFRLFFAFWWPLFGFVYSYYGLVTALCLSSLILWWLAIYASKRFKNTTSFSN